MLLHAFFCCSAIGAFYVFLLIDAFVRDEQFGVASEEGSLSPEPSIGDRTIMFILSLPFLVIFIIGCHSMYLLNQVFDEIKQAKSDEYQMVALDSQPNQRVNDEYELLKLPPDSNQSTLCVICLDKERDSIFYPCGHECVCQTCGKQFMQKAV